VLIHGGVQGTRHGGITHFARQQQLAARGMQLLVPDRPGHGLSPSEGRPDDAEADGEWVAELLGDGAHLIGHSFGGCIALNAAARRPSAVQTLTLIEPGMQALAANRFPVAKFLVRLVTTLAFSFSPETRIRRFSRLMHIPDEVGGGSTEELRAMGKAASEIRIPSKRTFEAQLALVKARAIAFRVISGGWEPGVDLTAERVAELGGGQYVRIESPHHFPQLHSNEFNELVVRATQPPSR
jgi:pimeloyl-ACP methyl ester carboxylesterase